LEDLKEADFVSFRTSLIGKILEKDKSLKEEYNRWYNEVQYPRTFFFDRAQSLAKEVEKLQKVDIVNFYNNFISACGKERRKFSVQVFAKDHTIPDPTPSDKIIYVTDPESWRKTQSHYPGFNTII